MIPVFPRLLIPFPRNAIRILVGGLMLLTGVPVTAGTVRLQRIL
jgi:hypothetical protein